MILKGNQRGNSKDLALHLLKEENERVEVHEIRGFCSDTLMGALNESYAMSRATKCKQHLFSLSLNPPKDAEVSNEEFEKAIAEVEERLGLTGQPRAIVFHEKEGPSGYRRHCHAVWSRIKADEMKAVQLSYSHNKLKELSREIYLEHGWKMPRGLVNSQERDPRNYSLAEWQQAKRAGRDAKLTKTQFQDAWAISDNQAALTHALQERGYKLARGDRRGFVAVDYQGEVYSLSKWVGVKPKNIKAKMDDAGALPDVSTAKDQIAQEMLAKMQAFQKQVEQEKQEKARKAEEERKRLAAQQKAKQDAQAHALKLRRDAEEKARQERIRRGLLGLMDRFTGKRKKTLALNEQEKQQSFERDEQEKETLIAEQNARCQQFIEMRRQEQQRLAQEKQELQKDVEIFQHMKDTPEDERKKAFMEKRRSSSTKNRIRGPTLDR